MSTRDETVRNLEFIEQIGVLTDFPGQVKYVDGGWLFHDVRGAFDPRTKSFAGPVFTELFDGDVAAGATNIDVVGPDPLPIGAQIRLLFFGASEMGTGDHKASGIALQWGSTGSWKTIRAVGVVSSGFQCPVDETFTGDGIKKFRLVRQNNSTTAKKIVGWATGYQI